MHKINWNNTGGHPLRMDDLDFMQESAIDAVNGIISAIQTAGQDHFILSGCRQQSDGSITSGWIVLNGELRKFSGFPAPLTALPAPNFYAFAANDYYDPNLKVTYKDQSQKDIYNYRSAQVVVLSSTDVNKPAVGSLQRWDDTWHQVGAANEPALGVGWANGGQGGTYGSDIGNVAFKKDHKGQVLFKGGVSFPTSATPLTPAFILPLGYRPLKDIHLITLANYSGSSGNPEPEIVSITTAGEVYPFTASKNEFWLEGLNYSTL